ncbi:hypothetical protein CCM_08719 [Cordyceps militaris CM01]|uniref:Kinase-like domain n=1 Tax=Cordyceps militaris (strain CM01) TaxID=983644 RepID=G3JS28_CORMM|nr:uncharacterized protein CCM_08719 [Cordyceps militaris CM01]EGX88674.1 hypothetical protein CCM_08719 [Cordyceps militaris CM01]
MNESPIQNTTSTLEWSVIDVSYSPPSIVVMCNHVRYVVHVPDAAFAALPALRALFNISPDILEQFEEDARARSDFYSWALEPLLPILRKDDEGIPRSYGRSITLGDVLYSPIVEYSLCVESGKMVVHPKEQGPETHFMFGASLTTALCNAWPRYLPLNIRLDARDDTLSSVPHHVLLPDGTRAFFQLLRRGDDTLLHNTLLAHHRIRAAAPLCVQVPRLLGLVHDARAVLGMLFADVGYGAVSLTRAVGAGAPARVRRRWSAQMMRTVHGLHQNRLVWGDARPGNVVIDEGQNAWLAGLGGVSSPTWVPPEQAGTMDGDLVALKRIVDFTEGGFAI